MVDINKKDIFHFLMIISQKKAVDLLRMGLPVVFQTDTLPAIGCIPEYFEKIYSVKKRDKNKALILMGSDISQVLSFVHESAVYDFKKIAEEFWPGPLTLVMPISDQKIFKFAARNNTLGIRIPDSLTAKSLIAETGPLATSSANISGRATSMTAEEILSDLPKLKLLGPIPWEKCSGNASTIIAWISKGKWKLIRKGQISIANIS